MTTDEKQVAVEVRERLIEAAGRTTQDLGLGRIVGQVLAYIYLAKEECSLDEIGSDLGLSKASISIAARQLDSLGLVKRVWKKGDRKNYYAMVDHFASALRKGLVDLVESKVRSVSSELDQAESLLAGSVDSDSDEEIKLLQHRVKLVRRYQEMASKIISSPVVKLLGR